MAPLETFFPMGPKTLPLEELGAELLYFAYRALSEGAEATLEKEGLGRLELRLMKILSRCEAVSPSFLSERTGTSRQYLNLSLRKLQDGGWILNSRDARDGRARCLELSAKGRKFLAKSEGPAREIIEQAAQNVGDAQFAAWLRVNRILVELAAERNA